ncbi:hypothetical protein [Paenibacillus sp. 481]|uniref:hypothetical protein n=1 Tax=Paenibacillus sp. 481 TaxID=2835869 RepID=UPI001E343E32|nr:hypothetical protein [Paenibacillus sp. 481]UHA73733.1 hypothetical protein KIK04_00725 [Paenibacillus sp. 481]
MLKERLLQQPSTYEAEVKSYIMNYGAKRITGIIYYPGKEYEALMYIYRSDKSQYGDPLEAFASLWTNALVDTEEWHSYFEPTLEFGHDIFENFFKKDVRTYTYNDSTVEDMREYICYRLKRMKELVQKCRKREPLEIDDPICYPTVRGIYVNTVLVDETKFELVLPAQILAGVELSYDASWAGYKTLFLETEAEYIFFTE